MMISIRKLKKKKDKSSDKTTSKRVTKKKNKSNKSDKSCKSSRRKKKSQDKKKKAKTSNNIDTDVKTDNKEEVSKEIFDTSTFTFKVDQSFEPSADNQTNSQRRAFDVFTRTVVSLGVEGLIKEYETNILGYAPNGFYARTVFDQNTPLNKNRYKDVVCNDLTRVVLKDGRPGDYIHANYVRGLSPTFILTQGPVKESISDFWRMIIQESIQLIVMLCEHVENGKKKCIPYFSLQPGKMDVGDFVVTTESVEQMDTHTIATTVVIQDRYTQKSTRITHYKIITWPDKTVAKSNLAILRTLRFVRSQQDPVVIHCSAGIGRTGTFTAVEIGIQCLLNGRNTSVSEITRYLRHCRMNSVQMDTQYLMLAEAIIDCGKSFKYVDDSNILEMVTKFKADIAKYVQEHPPPVEKKDKSNQNTEEDKEQQKAAQPPQAQIPQQVHTPQQAHTPQAHTPQQVHPQQPMHLPQQVHPPQPVHNVPPPVHTPQQVQVAQQQHHVPQPVQVHVPQQAHPPQQVHIPQQIYPTQQQVRPPQQVHVPQQAYPPQQQAHPSPQAHTPLHLQQLQLQVNQIHQQQQMAAMQQKKVENQMVMQQQQQQQQQMAAMQQKKVENQMVMQQQQQQQQHVEHATLPARPGIPAQPAHQPHLPVGAATTPAHPNIPPQK